MKVPKPLARHQVNLLTSCNALEIGCADRQYVGMACNSLHVVMPFDARANVRFRDRDLMVVLAGNHDVAGANHLFRQLQRLALHEHAVTVRVGPAAFGLFTEHLTASKGSPLFHRKLDGVGVVAGSAEVEALG